VATLDNLSDVEAAPSSVSPPTSTLEVPVPSSDTTVGASGAVDPAAASTLPPDSAPSTTIADSSSTTVP
jgi:hypothetical protein